MPDFASCRYGVVHEWYLRDSFLVGCRDLFLVAPFFVAREETCFFLAVLQSTSLFSLVGGKPVVFERRWCRKFRLYSVLHETREEAR